MQKLRFPPIRIKPLTVSGGFLASFRSADPDAAPVQRNGAAFPGDMFRGQNRFAFLRITRFIGKMVGERTQGFYINRATASLKNINGFLQRAQCGGDLCNIACGQRRMVGNYAQEAQLWVEPPFFCAF